METRTEIFPQSERDRFVAAMVVVGAECGYAETSVEALTERAGLPLEKFEKIFGAKGGLEECALAAENAIIGDVLSAVSASYSADRSEWDSGILGMRAILELMAANPSVAKFGYITCKYMAPPRVRQSAESARQVMAAMIDRLREGSEAHGQPPNTARAALGSAETLLRREIMAGRTDQLPRLLPDLVYGATVGLLGQEEALRLSRRGRELLRGTAWEHEE